MACHYCGSVGYKLVCTNPDPAVSEPTVRVCVHCGKTYDPMFASYEDLVEYLRIRIAELEAERTAMLIHIGELVADNTRVKRIAELEAENAKLRAGVIHSVTPTPSPSVTPLPSASKSPSVSDTTTQVMK